MPKAEHIATVIDLVLEAADKLRGAHVLLTRGDGDVYSVRAAEAALAAQANIDEIINNLRSTQAGMPIAERRPGARPTAVIPRTRHITGAGGAIRGGDPRRRR
jgi:hypothetical protein